MNEKTYEIQELVETAQVPRRNIYFYVQQGLLPPPAGAGLAARYGEEHLLRLRLIPLLRARGLRLDQIRAQFDAWGRAEMEQALASAAGEAAPAITEIAPPRPIPLRSKALEQPVGQASLRYDLPGGLVLIAPATLSPLARRLLDQILRLAAGEE